MRDAFPVGRAAFGALRASVEAAIGRPGASSLLAAAAGTGGLSTDEVVSNAAVLMFGGIETTEGMICNAILHLLSHPAQLSLVAADRGLLPGAVEESLRLEPSAAVVDRYATAERACSRPPGSGAATWSSSRSRARTVTRWFSPSRTGSTSGGRTPGRTSASRAARISARARSWPASRPAPRSMR